MTTENGYYPLSEDPRLLWQPGIFFDFRPIYTSQVIVLTILSCFLQKIGCFLSTD